MEKIDELKKKHSHFWNCIAPIALLLNPSVPFDLFLSKEEISRAKNSIIKKMEKYSLKEQEPKSDHPEYLTKYYQNRPKVNRAPLEKILDERNVTHSSDALKSFWFEKLNTAEKLLALVAIDILAIVITSDSSKLSFSRGSLIINEQRTRISPEHAR